MSGLKDLQRTLGVKDKQEVGTGTVTALSPWAVTVTLPTGRQIRCPRETTQDLATGDHVLVSIRKGGQGAVIRKATETPPSTLSHYVVD